MSAAIDANVYTDPKGLAQLRQERIPLGRVDWDLANVVWFAGRHAARYAPNSQRRKFTEPDQPSTEGSAKRVALYARPARSPRPEVRTRTPSPGEAKP